MARSAILGNGELTVGLDEQGLVHDFYFPHVGQDNLTTARSMHHKIGIWINDQFSWLDDNSIWQSNATLDSKRLFSEVSYQSDKFQLQISISSFVDHKYNFLGRKVSVINHSENIANIRVFMHQVFQISNNGRSDTALYVPTKHYIYNYESSTCLLISGRFEDSDESFNQYAVGSYGIEGKVGTYVDAEDGELSGQPVEHAGVDSVIRFSLELDPGKSRGINYWVVADNTQVSCEQTHALVLESFDERLKATSDYWHNWIEISKTASVSIDSKHAELLDKSIMLIKAHCDKQGGVIASCDSSIYNYGRDYYSYVWPRDGAFAIRPLIELGYGDEPKAFFKFCSDLITDDGYMMHKFQPDKSVGSSWHPLIQQGTPELAIQEDETALPIIMLYEYWQKSKDDDFVREIYDKFVIKAANFMCNYIDVQTGLPHGSYDLWEQKFLTTTFTTATVIRALSTCSKLAEAFGENTSAIKWQSMSDKILSNFSIFINPDTNTLRKGFYLQKDGSLNFDNTLDVSSFYGVMEFIEDDSLISAVHSTKDAIETQLLNQAAANGVARYPGDGYFRSSDDLPSNAWPIATLWLAQYYIKLGDKEKVETLIEIVTNKLICGGILSEQISSLNGEPISVSPLVWSHAEFVKTMLINKK